MKNRAEWVGRHVSEKDRILDVGIKDAYVWNLLGFYPDVAVDIHPEDVPKEVKEKVDFIEETVYLLPFNEDAFDVVVITEVLEHVSHPTRALRRCYEVGGKVVGTVPRGDHESKYPQFHEFERGSLMRILGNVSPHYTVREVETSNWEGFGFIIEKIRG